MRTITLAVVALLLLPSSSWADGRVFELTEDVIDIYLGHSPVPATPWTSARVDLGDAEQPAFAVTGVTSAVTSLDVGVDSLYADVVDVSLLGPSEALPDLLVWPSWEPVTVPAEYRTGEFLTFLAAFDDGSEVEFDIQLVAQGPELLSVFMFNPQPEPPALGTEFEFQTEWGTPPDDGTPDALMVNPQPSAWGADFELQAVGVTPPDDNTPDALMFNPQPEPPAVAALFEIQTEWGTPPDDNRVEALLQVFDANGDPMEMR